MDISGEKKALRRRMKDMRSALSPMDRDAWSAAAAQRLLDSGLWRSASSVALFFSVRSEISTFSLIEAGLAEKKALFFPRVRRNEPGVMEFVRVGSLSELAPGCMGIPEPEPWLPGILPGKAFAPDLAVVPGLAFDRQGVRLGYGGGYYDRFFAADRTFRTVGLCFGAQVVENVPAGVWDMRVDYVCTEKGLFPAGVRRRE